MKTLKEQFFKQGGFQLIKQYIKLHILIYTILLIFINGFSKKSLEIVRLSTNNKILSRYRKKYATFCREFKESYYQKNYTHKKNNVIWVCWFQGMENAPQLVKKCYESLQNIDNREIILITEQNFKDYTKLPEFILKKYESGCITKTHLSDLIRLDLLIRHGGTWIDATVWYSKDVNIPDYMLNSDLFLFQNLKPGLDGQCTRISNWFITSCTNDPILMLTRDMLYLFWEKNNQLNDYFIFHKLFEISIETFPNEWNKVYPSSNSSPHILLLRLNEEFNQYIWNHLKYEIPFHKLSYKVNINKDISDSFYRVLINEDI